MLFLDFSYFLNKVLSTPFLLIIFLLTLGVVFVNGWTDAPNAIATCISTKAISPHNAVIMSAFFNFLGVLVMTQLNSTVAMTVKNIVSFKGDISLTMTAFCAAMTAIILWALIAWFFGIPTSESHALIAGLSGAAVALNNSFDGINAKEWLTVIFGLFLSTFLGFFLGYFFAGLIKFICKNTERKKSLVFFKNAQIFGGAAMSFMHGAQDGQKFLGVMILGIFLSEGYDSALDVSPPLWMMLLVSAVMALGTSVGGYKIIKKVGLNIAKLEGYQGFAADAAAASCLLFSSLFGLPVSTTHTKTTAIVGVGVAKRPSNVNFGVVKEMILTWVFTFPCCSIIGYAMAKLFIHIFIK